MIFRILKYNFRSCVTKTNMLISILIFIIMSLNSYRLIQVIPKVTGLNINIIDNLFYTFGGLYNNIVHSRTTYIINLLLPYLVLSIIIGSYIEKEFQSKIYLTVTRISSLKTWYSGLLFTLTIVSALYLIIGHTTILITLMFKLPLTSEYSSHIKELLNTEIQYSPINIFAVFFFLQFCSILTINFIQLIVSILTQSSLKGILSVSVFYIISAVIETQNYEYLKLIPGTQIVILRNNMFGLNGINIYWSIIYNLLLCLLIYWISLRTIKKVGLNLKY